MIKIFRTSTVPISLNVLLKGQLKFLNQDFQVTAISGPGEDLSEVQEREGVRIIPVEMQRQISPLKDLISLYLLFRLFQREKPQIVHSITPKAGLLSMVAAKLAGVPIRMHTFTGLIFPSRTGIMQKILITMDKLLCACATHIYPEGEGVKKDLQRFGITSKPLKVLGNGNVNGIDLDYFHPQAVSEEARKSLRDSLELKEGDLVFVFVGRLVTDKGINELVEAFSKLESRKLKLLLVGPFEDDLDPLLPKTIAEIQTNTNIISVGFQKDIRPFLSVSDIFVFPSYREGFPNVVLQTGAMGLPSIVTDISGSNEIIQNGINGLIIPPQNTEELRKAMLWAAANPGAMATFGHASQANISEKYDQQFVWECLKNEYDILLEHHEKAHSR